MLARKTITGKEQIKKINEQLKASKAEEPQKSENLLSLKLRGKNLFHLKQNR